MMMTRMMMMIMILLSHSHIGDRFELCYCKEKWLSAMMDANFLGHKFSSCFSLIEMGKNVNYV